MQCMKSHSRWAGLSSVQLAICSRLPCRNCHMHHGIRSCSGVCLSCVLLLSHPSVIFSRSLLLASRTSVGVVTPALSARHSFPLRDRWRYRLVSACRVFRIAVVRGARRVQFSRQWPRGGGDDRGGRVLSVTIQHTLHNTVDT